MNTSTNEAGTVTVNNETANNEAAPAQPMVTLTRVSADYKLDATKKEFFLVQGRKHPKHKDRAYFHTVAQTPADSLPVLTLPADTNAALRIALTKLWDAATLEHLKNKAAPMDAGVLIELTVTQADICQYIADIGNRERVAISGDELQGYADSYAFKAVAEVHGWTAQQVARVAAALKQYAAPAHKKPVADATVLLTRLHPILTTLLTGEEEELDADILRIHEWLVAKLQRDVNAAPAVNLSEAI